VSLVPTTVSEAAWLLRGTAVRTPLLSEPTFDAVLGRRVLIKAEGQQRTGSFKFRGAYVALEHLSHEQRAAGVIAASTGNHARALVQAARLHKTFAAVVLPDDAPRVHRKAIAALDGRTRVISCNPRDRGPEGLAQQIAYSDRLTLVPAANHASVIAGAGTVALEMLEQVPDLTAILVPIGGGALAAGTVLAAQLRRSRVKVIGVEPANAPDTHASVRTGRHTRIAPPTTIADGLRHIEPAPIPFGIIKDRLDDIVLVPEQEISEAMALLWHHYGTTAEPSGAVALAGLMRAATRLPPGPIGVIVTGRNVDWTTYRALLDRSEMHIQEASGLPLSAPTELADRAGRTARAAS
jgi:threonine dehydratase